MGRQKKNADQKEYEILTAEHAAVTARYNKEQNFIQKNNIHLQLQKLNGRLRDLEGKIGTASRPTANYQSALK